MLFCLFSICFFVYVVFCCFIYIDVRCFALEGSMMFCALVVMELVGPPHNTDLPSASTKWTRRPTPHSWRVYDVTFTQCDHVHLKVKNG